MKNLTWSVAVVLACPCLRAARRDHTLQLASGSLRQGTSNGAKWPFLTYSSNSCHTVTGVEPPAPSADAELHLALGGAQYEVRTDGYLVTSIIHPSHRLGKFPKQLTVVEGKSWMPDFSRRMTVRSWWTSLHSCRTITR